MATEKGIQFILSGFSQCFFIFIISIILVVISFFIIQVFEVNNGLAVLFAALCKGAGIFLVLCSVISMCFLMQRCYQDSSDKLGKQLEMTFYENLGGKDNFTKMAKTMKDVDMPLDKIVGQDVKLQDAAEHVKKAIDNQTNKMLIELEKVQP